VQGLLRTCNLPLRDRFPSVRLDDERPTRSTRPSINAARRNCKWSLYGVPEQLENDETQKVYWELQKYHRARAEGEPERARVALYSPIVEDHQRRFGENLLSRCVRRFCQSSSFKPSRLRRIAVQKMQTDIRKIKGRGESGNTSCT